MYNCVNYLQFNIRCEKVERPAPVGGALVCNLQSRSPTHAVLVIGLYELLNNPTTQPIEPPGSFGGLVQSNLL